jgi:hypothetical protein
MLVSDGFREQEQLLEHFDDVIVRMLIVVEKDDVIETLALFFVDIVR